MENLGKSVRLDNSLQLARAHLETRFLLMAMYLDQGNVGRLRELTTETLIIAPGDDRSLLCFNATSVKFLR